MIVAMRSMIVGDSDLVKIFKEIESSIPGIEIDFFFRLL